MEINKAKQLAAIDTEKFGNMVEAIGPETIKAIANAGPQMQVGRVEIVKFNKREMQLKSLLLNLSNNLSR